MLVNALQLSGTDVPISFTDQDKIGIWAKESIDIAVQLEIVTGYSDGSFRPDAYITREEMATMIARGLGIHFDGNAQTDFVDDEEISPWAKGAVEAIRQLEIIHGRSNDQFAPKETATRAEAVVMLLRLLDKNL